MFIYPVDLYITFQFIETVSKISKVVLNVRVTHAVIFLSIFSLI